MHKRREGISRNAFLFPSSVRRKIIRNTTKVDNKFEKRFKKKKKTRSHSNSVHTVTTTTRANPESDDVIQRLGKTRNDDRRPQTSVSRFKHHKNKRRRSLATPLTDVVFKIRSSCKFTSTSMKGAWTVAIVRWYKYWLRDKARIHRKHLLHYYQRNELEFSINSDTIFDILLISL